MKDLFKYFVILLLILAFGDQIFAQKTNIKIDSREVVLNYPDSTVKVNITLIEKKYKPKTSQVYYWYKSNEIKKNLGGYSGRLLNGKYTTYDLNKNMVTEGFFTEGVKTGVWKSWYQKGGLQRVEQYKDGKKHGEFVYYHSNGQLRSVINYKKGQLHGKYMEYMNDTIYLEKNYKKGVEIIPQEKQKKVKETEQVEEQEEKTVEADKEEKVKLTKEEKQALKEKKQAEKAAEKEKKQAEKEAKQAEKERLKLEKEKEEKVE